MYSHSPQNHSCDPNLTVLGYYCDQSDVELPAAAFFTSRDVKRNEELCMSYFGVKSSGRQASAQVSVGRRPHFAYS